MAEIITTVDTQEIKQKMTGADKNYEMKDFPLKETDQSKVISTHNIVPNKRAIAQKDIDKVINNIKPKKKASEKKEKKIDKNKAEQKTTRGRKKKNVK